MKVSELIGAKLDDCVAQCEGRCLHKRKEHWAEEDGNDYESGIKCLDCRKEVSGQRKFSPSTEWDQGGPIIEREGIESGRLGTGKYYATINRRNIFIAENQLVAAMQCYVASKFGENVPDDK